MSVYKIRYGTPEAIVPSRFAPNPVCDIRDDLPENSPTFGFSVSPRGIKITMPIDPTAGIYGFGLQLKGFQHRGTKKHIRPNADPVSNSGDTHAPVPFFVTTQGFGLYVDTARYATFYCGKELRSDTVPQQKNDENRLASSFDDIYAIREGSEETILTIEIPLAKGVDLYYITGESILSIVSQYNLLSGGGCMPPMWGLGCFYRCDLNFNQEQVLAMANRIRQLRIPCDILGLEPGWQSHSYSCSYVWDEGRFPDATAMAKEISDNGFHLNLWEHAFTHPSSPIYKDLLSHSGDYLVWNGLVPDFALPQARQIFADYHKNLVEMGVTGFKLDECDGSDFTGGWTFPNCAAFPSGMDGEQYHSLFGTLYAQTIQQALGDHRTLSEVRNLGALAASYPFVLYSDLYGHKDFITGVVNAGFSGLLWSPEVRHAANAEDLIRRVQSVIFSPQALINAFYLSEMPWEMHHCTDEIRELFGVRMSLIPYLFTAFYDYHTQGKPPVRALVCDYEKEPEALDCKDEYLFGDAMIVAPMTAPEKERRVWLPKGVWYDFFTGNRYEGGTHNVETDRIPVFVREGTLLPIAEPVEYIRPDTCFAITLRAYGDCKDAICRLVEDSDESTNATYREICLRENSLETNSSRYRIDRIEHIG